MSEQDNTVDQQPNANGSGEPTQIGQITRANMPTRQLAAPVQPRQVNSATRERITNLVAALGDTEHPLHQQAVQDLVAIGDPAVPALNEALSPRRPWLTSFRAAEALGQIGDGRATGALIEALRHPNSNVRWSAVRALAVIGDARAMLDLRRIANEDRAKTTWGEPVAGAAESALEQMRAQNVLFRGAELIKTALACVAMLVALVIAWSILTTLRADLQSVGKDRVDTAALFAPITPTPDPLATATAEAEPTAEVTPEPTQAPVPETGAALPSETLPVTGTVLTAANVRSEPTSQRDNKIGSVSPGDDVVFLAATADNKWYRVQLGERRKPNSRIESADGSGWIIATLLSKPEGTIPIESPELSTTTDTEPTVAPQP